MALYKGQSSRVLKLGYTGGSREQGFQRCFADRYNQSLVPSAAQAKTSVVEMIATEFDCKIKYNWFRVVLHTVDSLNVNHELRSKKKIKAILYHADISNDISPFAN